MDRGPSHGRHTNEPVAVARLRPGRSEEIRRIRGLVLPLWLADCRPVPSNFELHIGCTRLKSSQRPGRLAVWLVIHEMSGLFYSDMRPVGPGRRVSRYGFRVLSKVPDIYSIWLRRTELP